MEYRFSLFDIDVAIILVVILSAFVWSYKRRKKFELGMEFLIPAFYTKVLGSVFFAGIYTFFYPEGDTTHYYELGESLANLFYESPSLALDILLGNYDNYISYSEMLELVAQGDDAFIMMKLSGIGNIICFRSYLGVSILFGFFSFIGMWRGFSFFVSYYPELRLYFAIAFFFIPSMTIWGSGILKDTLCMGAIGFILHLFHQVFMKKQRIIISLIGILVYCIVIIKLKPYLAYLFIPVLIYWVQFRLKKNIESNFLRYSLSPVIFSAAIAIIIFSVTYISENSSNKYAVENLSKTVIGFQNWHTRLANERGQSGYSLGEVEFTATGIISKLPIAVTTALYRPFPWEARNVLSLASAFENIILILLSLLIFFNFVRCILNRRVQKILRAFRNPEVRMCLIFTIGFAFIVGFTSYNFGALSRYRIPLIPFFITGLFLLNQILSGRSLEKKNLIEYP